MPGWWSHEPTLYSLQSPLNSLPIHHNIRMVAEERRELTLCQVDYHTSQLCTASTTPPPLNSLPIHLNYWIGRRGEESINTLSGGWSHEPTLHSLQFPSPSHLNFPYSPKHSTIFPPKTFLPKTKTKQKRKQKEKRKTVRKTRAKQTQWEKIIGNIIMMKMMITINKNSV